MRACGHLLGLGGGTGAEYCLVSIEGTMQLAVSEERMLNGESGEPRRLPLAQQLTVGQFFVSVLSR